MGRRKIEIKAIKDDRNRSVTFLKRKGGLFKKAHELSVLCSVDVAVFIFGSNKKLYEYSSSDMRELIHRYTYHGGPNEHKGPADFNGGAEDEDDDEDNGTPPQGDGPDAQMLPPQYAGQPQFPQIRHHTPSASPPIPNGMFGTHGAHAIARTRSPQPPMGSRPSSRNDVRRVCSNMVPQSVGSSGGPLGPAVNGFAYMPQPAMYNTQHPQSVPPSVNVGMAPVHPQYGSYHAPQPHPQMQQYLEEQRRFSVPPSFPPQGHSAPPPPPRHSASPPQPHQQLPPQSAPHMSPPPPQTHLHPRPSPPQPQHQPSSSPRPPVHELPRVQAPQEYHPPAPVEPRHDVSVKQEPAIERVRPPLLDTAVKKHKGSIFTPIDENRSILSQHLAAFHPPAKQDAPATRPHSADAGELLKQQTSSPPSLPPVSGPQRSTSFSAMSEAAFIPLSRSSSNMQTPTTARPLLKVQIPDEPSEINGSATAESSSPRGPATGTPPQPSRRATETHASGAVLPPPSPSASALLSAGASGPPNPFARPVPNQSNSMNMDTPVSALPSRFLQGEFLPSPSSFYPDWNFRGAEHNALPSPLNFATPVTDNGPSFLRDDPPSTKRKRVDMASNGPSHEGMGVGNEPKRVKVDT